MWVPRTGQHYGEIIGSTLQIDLVHLGEMFSTCSGIRTIAAAGTTDHLLIVPAAYDACHLWYRVESNAEFWTTLYENPTITNNGVAMNVYNVNRTSANTTLVTAFRASVIAAPGVALECQIGGAGNKIGGTTESGMAWHGDGNQDYLIRVTTTAVNQEIVVAWRFHTE